MRNILHLGLRCTYTYKFYYMPIRHICNVRFNFFVFNLSPWPFLDWGMYGARRAQLILLEGISVIFGSRGDLN